MTAQKKAAFTAHGGIEDKLSLFNPPLDGISKYELVLLLAKRAKEINQNRIDLQKKYKIRLIEKRKAIMVALDEYLQGKLKWSYATKSKVEKKEEEEEE